MSHFCFLSGSPDGTLHISPLHIYSYSSLQLSSSLTTIKCLIIIYIRCIVDDSYRQLSVSLGDSDVLFLTVVSSSTESSQIDGSEAIGISSIWSVRHYPLMLDGMHTAQTHKYSCNAEQLFNAIPLLRGIRRINERDNLITISHQV